LVHVYFGVLDLGLALLALLMEVSISSLQPLATSFFLNYCFEVVFVVLFLELLQLLCFLGGLLDLLLCLFMFCLKHPHSVSQESNIRFDSVEN
jgi:predicted neutral ceramidase superfamily lipid hydrolase